MRRMGTRKSNRGHPNILTPFPSSHWFSLFFGSFQILKGVAHLVHFFPVAFGIAIFQELAVAAVKTAGSSRVFDRTPVLFRSAGDLTDVGDQSVEVSAVHAVQLFNGVEVAEGIPVDDNVAAAFDLGDLVDGKADGLEQGDEGIHEQGWNQAAPDKGNGQDILDFRLFQIAGDPGGKEFMLLSDLLVKAYFFALDLVREFSLFFLELLGQLLLQFFNGLDQALQFGIHCGPVVMLKKREKSLCYLLVMVAITRRFCWRPFSVALEATGRENP